MPITVAAGAIWMLLGGALSSVSIGPVSVSAALTVLLASMLVAWLPAYASSGVRPHLPTLLWAFLFYVGAGASAMAVGNTLDIPSVQNALAIVLLIGAIASASIINDPPAIERSWQLMRATSTWTAYIYLLISAFNVSTPLGTRPRAIIAIFIVAILAPGNPRNGWEKFAPYAAVGATILSLSRTASLVTLLLLAFIVFRRTNTLEKVRNARAFKAYLLVAVGLTAAVLTFSFYSPLRSRFLGGDNAVRLGEISFSTSGRSKIWGLLLSDNDRLFFGHGPGTASQLIQQQLNIDHPHNEYLRLLYDFGIVGLTLFASAYLALALRILRNARATDEPIHWAAFAAMLGIALQSLTDSCFVFPWVALPLGTLIGLSLALANVTVKSGVDGAVKTPPRNALSGTRRMSGARDQLKFSCHSPKQSTVIKTFS